MKGYDDLERPHSNQDAPIAIVSGNTYPHKENLKNDFHLLWDPAEKIWTGRIESAQVRFDLEAYCKRNRLECDISEKGFCLWASSDNTGYCLDYHTTNEYLGEDERGRPKFQRTETGELLYQFKYKGIERAGAEIISIFLERTHMLSLSCYDYIIPVPATNLRRRDQPVLWLSRELSKKLDVPLLEGLTSFNKLQQKEVVNPEERRKELMESIGLTSNCKIKNKSVILFDDILGSGTTIEVCNKKLLLAGAKFVLALTVTRKR